MGGKRPLNGSFGIFPWQFHALTFNIHVMIWGYKLRFLPGLFLYHSPLKLTQGMATITYNEVGFVTWLLLGSASTGCMCQCKHILALTSTTLQSWLFTWPYSYFSHFKRTICINGQCHRANLARLSLRGRHEKVLILRCFSPLEHGILVTSFQGFPM